MARLENSHWDDPLPSLLMIFLSCPSRYSRRLLRASVHFSLRADRSSSWYESSPFWRWERAHTHPIWTRVIDSQMMGRVPELCTGFTCTSRRREWPWGKQNGVNIDAPITVSILKCLKSYYNNSIFLFIKWLCTSSLSYLIVRNYLPYFNKTCSTKISYLAWITNILLDNVNNILYL